MSVKTYNKNVGDHTKYNNNINNGGKHKYRKIHKYLKTYLNLGRYQKDTKYEQLSSYALQEILSTSLYIMLNPLKIILLYLITTIY